MSLQKKAAKNAAEWDILALDEQDSEENEKDVDDEKSEDFTIYDVGRVTCDACECVIVGKRWHAIEKEDYDLCDACYEKQENRKKVEDSYILVIQSLPEEEKKEEVSKETVLKKQKN